MHEAGHWGTQLPACPRSKATRPPGWEKTSPPHPIPAGVCLILSGSRKAISYYTRLCHLRSIHLSAPVSHPSNGIIRVSLVTKNCPSSPAQERDRLERVFPTSTGLGCLGEAFQLHAWPPRVELQIKYRMPSSISISDKQ